MGTIRGNKCMHFAERKAHTFNTRKYPKEYAMPIKWKPRDNKLTDPPSYAAFPVDMIPLGIDDIARNINVLHPTITPSDVKIVLNAFRNEVLYQISNGNSIDLENFLRIYPTVKQRLDDPNQLLKKRSVYVRASVSVDVVNEIRQVVTFEKIPYMPKKQPSILSAAVSDPVLEGSIFELTGFKISGSNMKFNNLVGDEGVFLLSPAGNIIKQENVSLSSNAKVIITPTLDQNLGPAGYASVDNVLSISTRYTEGGELRTGVYSGYVRQKNFVGGVYINRMIFVIGQDVSSSVVVKEYDGKTVDINCILIKTPEGDIYSSVGNIGSQGDNILISGNGDVVLSGDGNELTIEVLDYDALSNTLTSRNNFIREILQISSIAGISFTTIKDGLFIASIGKTGAAVNWDMGNGDIVESNNALVYSGYTDSSEKNITVYGIDDPGSVEVISFNDCSLIGKFPDIGNYINIETIDIYNNSISGVINITSNVNLVNVDFKYNELSGTLDLSSNINLVNANFRNNQFSGTLDLSSNANLVNANFRYNQFSGTLDLSSNINLVNADFRNNQFSGALDLSSNINLVNANFGYNQFSGTLDLSSNANLVDANFRYNQFSGTLDLSLNPNIVNAYLNSNELTDIAGSLTQCINLSIFDISDNIFGTANISSAVNKLWDARNVIGANSCFIKLSGSGTPDATAIDQIEGTGGYSGDGLKDAGCTVVYST